ncbi:transmembrane signal receptor [Lithospermum erythrorhizon]|uniref:Transmembrane signal receptor n=1 Tax=Lithospermum erythrorhizon TaxID=34254 RepID=A0AAV3PW61_LITER
MVTVRAFLAIEATKNTKLHQMEVHNAFLHGNLDEEVYMKVPSGFSKGQEGKVCKLRKSLYGLKQAPRCWFSKLCSALKWYGFRQSYSDYSLFILSKDKIQINVLIYVDDLIISGNNSAALTLFKRYLSSCFHMKDLGILKYFLGIEVARGQEVHILSHFLNAPRQDYWTALRVLRYLKGCLSQGIFLKSQCNLKLSGWCDSDWASYPLTRRSVSGWVVFLRDSPIAWKMKKQVSVSKSSPEAKYMSMAATICELKWLKDILTKTLRKRQFEFLLHKLGTHDLYTPT